MVAHSGSVRTHPAEPTVTVLIMVPDGDAERNRTLTGPPSELENELRTKLEALVPGVRVTGVAGTGPVDLVAVKWVGGTS